MSGQEDQSPGPPISPPLIVGIVILAAFVGIIIAASVFRFCHQDKSLSAKNGSFEAAYDNMGEIDNFNPNQVRPPSQVARMKEVRKINNMYAWERGRQARLETGELRPTTMIEGNRRGEDRDWDEWSVWENDLESTNPTRNYGGSAYFYSLEDPYAQSSQQRLSQAASVLLPHAVHLNLNQGWRESRLQSPDPPPRDDEQADINIAGEDDRIEELAAAAGVGLGHGMGYQTSAQQALRDSRNARERNRNLTPVPSVLLTPPRQ